ncbi:MAG: peptide chain release factor 1 [Pseudomonadota bacterium]|nr:peptide chain release factor 1 [Pseudomonadota bacterium]|tara:strand:- start:1705 stop:2787 length:1083 start_codon:yes stop_codon:yes gene_type:complete
MKDSLRAKLEDLLGKYKSIQDSLSNPDIIGNQEKYKELSVEYSKLKDIVANYNKFLNAETSLKESKEIEKSKDSDLNLLIEDEIKKSRSLIEELSKTLEISLLPEDPHDNSNVFLEVRAGTGGLEAAIFAGDLYKMYSRFVERKNWKIELLSENQGDQGGYKLVVIRILGEGAYSKLKFESGAHRVQRVPETESQGRVHTSAATVAVLPEIDEVEEVNINPEDLRIDTFRASGAGGQHVNKTDSAIRITHIPSGCVVECQEDRSQHKNKARALALLNAKLLDIEKTKQKDEQSQLRKQLVGSGDRSERIRTYNFPQGRVTDHRINLTLYNLEELLDGDLDKLAIPLMNEYQAALLSENEF